MKLFIHTYDRWDKTGTFEALPAELQENCVLVVQEREVHRYLSHPAKLWVLPKNIKRLSPTRQFMIERAEEVWGDRYICMMDDDFINFGYRNDPDKWNLKVATPHQVKLLFRKMERWLGMGLAHCGISSRVANNRIEKEYLTNARMTQLLCYDLHQLREAEVRFDRVPCMQDFDMTLQLLTKGYDNRVLYRGCTNARGTGQKGGCASYRTPEMQSKTARKLKKLHPDFVRLREKQTKDWPEPITDVTISWKKAGEYGRTHRDND